MNTRNGFIAVLLCMAGAWASFAAPSLNGFDLSNSSIPVGEIRSGGPPRDGIPSIDRPRFIAPSEAGYMKNDDSVLSVTLNGETRAYPLRIIVWHEIVNDRIGDTSFVVAYCPLCATAMVFGREWDGVVLEFGVSGLLYQSDVLMYDRQTESLWTQLGMKAISGPRAGTSLKWMPSEQMNWAQWKMKYPDGRVLSDQTGFGRNYSGTAYKHYRNSPGTMFPVPRHRTELKQKEMVAGVIVDGRAKAYPIALLEKKPELTDRVGDTVLLIRYDATARHVTVLNEATGEPVPSVQVYWFAWQAFYPDTALLD